MTSRGEKLPASQKPLFLQLKISDRNEIQLVRSLVAYSCFLRTLFVRGGSTNANARSNANTYSWSQICRRHIVLVQVEVVVVVVVIVVVVVVAAAVVVVVLSVVVLVVVVVVLSVVVLVVVVVVAVVVVVVEGSLEV